MRLTAHTFVLVLAVSPLLGTPASSEGLSGARDIVPSFDTSTRTGSLQALGQGTISYEVQARQNETPQEVVEAEVEGQRTWLALWKNLGVEREISPEVWRLVDGEPQLVYGGLPRVRWHQARVVRKDQDGEVRLLVRRALVGENQEEPLLDKIELLRLGQDGLRVLKERYDSITTPAQRLNVVVDRLSVGDVRGARRHMTQLPRAPADWLARAGVAVTRFAPTPESRAKGKELLDVLADAPGETGMLAAERLLEMDWEEQPWME